MAITYSTAHVVILAAIVLCFLVLFFYRSRRSHKNRFVERSQTRHFQQPPQYNPPSQSQAIFIDLSPRTSELVDLAIEIWRIQNRIIKASSDIQEIHKRGLESSLIKLQKYLTGFHIEVIDHTNEKYNEGLSVDVLSFENSPDISIPIIKETIEPTIICEGKVIRKGKVVVIKNNN